jgi:sialic acid synthase SpsE
MHSMVVGDGEPCCIVAEIGQNHNGDVRMEDYDELPASKYH